MGGLWENVAVGVIVGLALIWAVWGLVRQGRAKKVCSSCSSSGECPLVNTDQTAVPDSTCAEPDFQVSSSSGDPR